MPFTDAQKRKAVELYLADGATAAAEKVGCSRRQIYRWLGSHSVSDEKRAEVVARHAEKREALRALLLDKAVDLLARMDDPHYDYKGKDAQRVDYDKATSGDVRSYATAAAILIDKYRLEMGEHTNRSEVTGDSAIDAEVRRLVDELGRQRQS